MCDCQAGLIKAIIVIVVVVVVVVDFSSLSSRCKGSKGNIKLTDFSKFLTIDTDTKAVSIYYCSWIGVFCE